MVSPSRVIWVFDKNKTEYVPVPVSELQQWMGKPVIVVLDCNAAEVLIPFAVKTICAVHPVRHRYSTTIVPSKSLLPPKNEHKLRLYQRQYVLNIPQVKQNAFHWKKTCMEHVAHYYPRMSMVSMRMMRRSNSIYRRISDSGFVYAWETIWKVTKWHKRRRMSSEYSSI